MTENPRHLCLPSRKDPGSPCEGRVGPAGVLGSETLFVRSVSKWGKFGEDLTQISPKLNLCKSRTWGPQLSQLRKVPVFSDRKKTKFSRKRSNSTRRFGWFGLGFFPKHNSRIPHFPLVGILKLGDFPPPFPGLAK